MKLYSILIIIFLFINSCIITQVPPNGVINNTPFWGLCILNDTIYYDQTEVTVASWLSYYTWLLENEGIESAMDVIPKENQVPKVIWDYMNTKSEVDSYYAPPHTHMKLGYFAEKCPELLEADDFTNSFYDNYKFKSCIYKDFPMTGISYEQAIKFCEWRTKMCGMDIATFRLPSRTEWKAIAMKGYSEKELLKNEKDSLFKEKLCAVYNYRLSKELCTTEKGIDSTFILQRATFVADKNNAYDIFGNVSEMTNEYGIAVGGNYKLFANQCHIDSIQDYCDGEIWLGFRCIAVKK